MKLIKKEVHSINAADNNIENISEHSMNSSLDDDDNRSRDEEDSFGMSERMKGQKLTHDQLKYIKSYTQNSNLTPNEL